MNKHYIKHFLGGLLLFLAFRVMILSDDLLTAVILGVLGISVLNNKLDDE
jgi:hypothetical protein